MTSYVSISREMRGEFMSNFTKSFMALLSVSFRSLGVIKWKITEICISPDDGQVHIPSLGLKFRMACQN